MTLLDTNTYLTYSPLLSDAENFGCDLLYHDDLISMVQFNFMLDIEFLMSNIKLELKQKIPVLIIHGLKETAGQLQAQAAKWSNVSLATPYIRDRFGVHHTKAMLLFFRDTITGIESAQVVIMTANMIPQDWQLMTQGVYKTAKCPLKSTTGTSESPFERDLLQYLRQYRLQSLVPVITKLSRFDWSLCKAIVIGSVPGYHRQSASVFTNWGLERMAEMLRQKAQLPSQNCQNSQVIIQCSSMPHSPERWFKEDVCKALSEFKNMHSSSIKPPRVCVVYPTMKTAAESFTGRDMSGDFLRFDQASYEKNHKWFDPYLYEWKSTNAGRQSLMPHIKTYTRIYQDKNDKFFVAWHLLTSANLSRAAWGEYQKNKTQIYIKSFELGVLFCPSLWEDEYDSVYMTPLNDMESILASHQLKEQGKSNEMEEEEEERVATVQVRLPFDLPLVHHPQPLQCFTRLS